MLTGLLVLGLDRADYVSQTCPWSGKSVAEDLFPTCEGHVVGVCNPGYRGKFDAATAHFEKAIDEKAAHL